MKLSTFKLHLKTLSELNFKYENGEEIAAHFHITEVGLLERHFIDCGGTVRKEQHINMQLWYAADYDHRLTPTKLYSIIELSELKINLPDAEIEIELQQQSISKFGVEFDGNTFVLKNKHTACLAEDACNIPIEKLKINVNELVSKTQGCCGDTGCC